MEAAERRLTLARRAPASKLQIRDTLGWATTIMAVIGRVPLEGAVKATPNNQAFRYHLVLLTET